MPEPFTIMPYLTVISWGFTGVGIAAILAAILPQATDMSSSWWTYTRKLLDLLGMNVFNAENMPQ